MNRIVKMLIIPILVLLLLAAAFVGSLYDYAVRNAHMVSENTYQALGEAATDQITLLKTKLDGLFTHLEILSRYAEAQGTAIDGELRTALELTMEKYGYSDMGMIDASTGEAKLLTGGSFDATGRDYFIKALTGERVIGYVESGRYSGITVFTLMVPVYENNQVAAVLFANYNPTGFIRLLDASAYGRQSYSYVTDRNGDIIINSGDPSALIAEGNVLEFFSSAEISGGLTVEDIAESMCDKDTLTFSFSSGGETRYTSCVPMGINDWCLFYLTPASTVEERKARSVEMMWDLVMKLAVIFIILFVLLTIRERKNRREISRSEEEYRVAASHSDRIIMRYDLQRKTISYAIGHTPANAVKRTLTTGVPESTIEAGLVAEDSIEAYLAFYEAMRRGERTGTQIARMKATSDEFAWFRADYTLLGGEKKNRYAIISFYDVTRERERELVYEKWQQSLHGRSPESYTLLRCNIGRDIRVDSREGELLAISIEQGGGSLHAQLEQYISRYVMREDAKGLSYFLNMEHLLSSYYKNERTLLLDYREKRAEGGYRWMRLTVETMACADAMAIGAYLLFEDINDAKLSELKLLQRAETDPLTALLNRATFEQRVDALIQEAGATVQHALLMLDVDSFKQINDVYGHDAGDQVLISIADALRAVTRACDLVSRLGGDEYVVFLCDISDETAAIVKAKQIRALIHNSFREDSRITVSIGIAFSPRDGADFETLYKKADFALYQVKGSTKDGEAVYNESNPDEPLL